MKLIESLFLDKQAHAQQQRPSPAVAAVSRRQIVAPLSAVGLVLLSVTAHAQRTFPDPSSKSAAPVVTTPAVTPLKAEASASDANALRKSRDSTRAAVEKTTSDQSSEIDRMTSLGATRAISSTRLLTSPQTAVRQPDKATVPPIADLLAVPGAAQLPRLLAAPTQPPQARAARRAAPKEPLLLAPVFTPDFSRQITTFSSLAGRSVLVLPRGEFAVDTTSRSADATTAANQGGVWGLPRLVDTGLQYSPVLEQARSQLDTALARSRQTRADLLPRVTVRTARGPERSTVSGATDAHTTRSTTLRLTQPLVDVPALRSWMGDLSAEQAATWRVKASSETVSLAITKATIDLSAARLVLDFSDEQFEQLNQILTYLTTRAQAGASSQADVERARTRVLVARQVRIDQQSAYRNALLELERLTGEKPEQLSLPFLNQLPGLPAQLADIRALARAQSYDLQALRADIEAQSQTVASQFSRYLPTLGLSLERDDAANVRGVNPRQIDQRKLLVMNWDISLGGREYYAGSAAQSELANRKAKLEEETERTMTAIDADFSLLRAATLRVDTGLAEQRAANAVVSAVQEQLRVGRISGSLLEALDAFERYFSARQRLAQTVGQQLLAQAQLLRRIGLLQTVADPTAATGTTLAPDPMPAMAQRPL